MLLVIHTAMCYSELANLLQRYNYWQSVGVPNVIIIAAAPVSTSGINAIAFIFART